jgi:predicted Zn-dependent protease
MPSMQQLQALLAKEPSDLFLNFALAMELAKNNRTDDSVAQFDKVLELDPRYLPAHFQKGRTLLAAGRRDEAKATLQAGIAAAQAAGDGHARDEMTELLQSL